MLYGTYDPGLTAFTATAQEEVADAPSFVEWMLLCIAFVFALITVGGVPSWF